MATKQDVEDIARECLSSMIGDIEDLLSGETISKNEPTQLEIDHLFTEGKDVIRQRTAFLIYAYLVEKTHCDPVVWLKQLVELALKDGKECKIKIMVRDDPTKPKIYRT